MVKIGFATDTNLLKKQKKNYIHLTLYLIVQIYSLNI